MGRKKEIKGPLRCNLPTDNIIELFSCNVLILSYEI